MAAHGAQKAFGWFDGPGPEKTATIMHGLGLRPGETYAQVAAANEIASGSLIALGLGGPAGPAMLISSMIVATVSVQWSNGLFSPKGGIEKTLLYGASALALAATDFGGVSLDALFGLRHPLRGPWLMTLALAGGVTGALVVLNARDQSPDVPATPTFRGKNSPLPEEAAAAN